MAGIVTLLTDFGESDAYVAAVKGVILSHDPGLTVVDVSHAVAPQDILEAAFILEAAWSYFPPGSVHVVVVDPGVGGARRRLVLEWRGHYFVGPDNGVLSAALPAAVRGRRAPGEAYTSRPVARALVPASRQAVRVPGAPAVAIENEALFLSPRSATFEGRDVFAPVAAFLAAGGRLEEVGAPVREVVAFADFRAPPGEASLEGLVLRVDRFGNLITDVRAEDLPTAPVFDLGNIRLEGLRRTYVEGEGLAAIVGSSGHVEIALPGGSAAAATGLGRWSRVMVSGA